MATVLSRGMTKAYNVLVSRGFGLGNDRECPLCGWTGFQFLPMKPGPFFRFDAKCPSCASLERHRLAYLLLKDELPARLGRVLHFAPEAQVTAWISAKAGEYVTADLMAPGVTHCVDIQAMPFEDGRFDFIWCSHVLEHVPDDAKAMRELRRVLRPGGIAVILVPVWGEETVEDVLDSDSARVERYFQEDHLRLYGRDITQRLNDAGFAVTMRCVEELPLQAVLRHSLDSGAGREVFLVR